MNTAERKPSPCAWLVTGAAGFIGSHLVEALLLQGHRVVGIDNFVSGKESNLRAIESSVGIGNWKNFHLMRGDIESLDCVCQAAVGCDVILHQAALGSVPLSLKNPLKYHVSNVTGFINVLEAARTAGIHRVVYASSSSVYGDCPDLPLRESSAGTFFSPYAATKWIDEIYAGTYAAAYGMETIGLRYFNVFGPRQDPNGSYAAVIPKWIQAMLSGDRIVINGSGKNTRDFCFVKDVVRANLKASTAALQPGVTLSLNVGSGRHTSLLELFEILSGILAQPGAHASPTHAPPRPGDILHSLADVSAAAEKIGFHAECRLEDSLRTTFESFANFADGKPAGTEAGAY
jgi:UDP-N-acetylglucosamine 4-epimerase